MVDSFLDPLNMAPNVGGAKENREIKAPSNRTPSTFQKIFTGKFNQPDATPDTGANTIPVSSIHSGMVEVSPTKLGSSEPKPKVNPSAAEDKENVEPSREQEKSTMGRPVEKPKTSTNLSEILHEKVEPKPTQSPPPSAADSDRLSPSETKPPAGIRESSAIGLAEEPVSSPQDGMVYTVERGDTLSHVVSSALKEAGKDHSAQEIYKWVNIIADQNQLRNPNLIYVGQKLDLSAVHGQERLAQSQPPDFNPSLPPEVRVPARGRITSRFGMRDHPILDREKFHTGVDIALNTGSPIHPMLSGLIVFAGERGGYGNLVEIDHGNGLRTRYGHLSDANVQVGEYVDGEKVIGLSGQTGMATGPHLHFEIRRNNEPIDPLTVIPAAFFETDSSSWQLS
ncbi:peptidoglycan DD-metalloendopeptidase family protein [bacterium]|nr:peptidoglycan DD-metalloendopeptidase family protein [bacterium]